ncbi:tetratricopeptide repeat protein [Mycobacterium simiae]|uniref:Tetratricopeptide repeat protein n=1 Tax=Mycobacterium simiae TaxID=1784 RepID=A0A5B1BNJ0_MYCSI|nr:tetratricopeptide repeat protein [Mycobacterium simiae]KAA1249030.1 tetratricopeptide repeat protein [Mycobacterium simiae]
MQVVEAYFDTGKYEIARESLRCLLSQHPNDPALLTQYSRAEYMLNNHVSAAHSAYAALSAAPQDEFAMRMYALSLEAMGRDWDALCMAWQTVLTHPNEPVVHRVYARLLRKARQTNNALYAADQALRLGPANAESLILRGAILHDLGRFPESDAMYREALLLDPDNADAINNLAINRLHRWRLISALRGFLVAAGAQPAMGARARRNIGAVLHKVFQCVTVVALVIGVFSAVVVNIANDGKPTTALRVIIAVLIAVLVTVLVWMLRMIPRRILASVLRQQTLVVLRLVHALLAMALGIWVAIFAWPDGLFAAGIALLLSGLFLAWVGLSI